MKSTAREKDEILGICEYIKNRTPITLLPVASEAPNTSTST